MELRNDSMDDDTIDHRRRKKYTYGWVQHGILGAYGMTWHSKTHVG
jgi:hypothetical protein